MTNLPPSNPQPSRREWDEFIAVVVALAGIGSILFWGLSRRPSGLDFNRDWLGSTIAPTASPNVLQPPEAEPERDRTGNLSLFPPSTPLPTAEASGVRPRPEEATPRTMTPPPANIPSPTGVPSPGIAPSPGAVVPVPIPAPGVAPSPGATPATTPQAAVSFSDVPANYWAAPFITALAQRGILSGSATGRFEPDRPATRAEYAIALQKALPLGTTRDLIQFNDVSPDFPGLQAIDAAVKGGFLKGFPDQTFRPDLLIPRHQVFLSLANGLRLPPQNDPEQVLNRFQDGGQVPGYGVAGVAAATQAGLVVNHPTPEVLAPERPMTRAEMAASLYQALVVKGDADAIESPFVVRP